MYNDEKNLYHYTYRKDGSESGQPAGEARPTVDEQLHSYQTSQQKDQPVQEMKPVKKNRAGVKIAALALVCALLGGAVGGGVVWGVSRKDSGSSTSVNVSNRTVSQVKVNSVDGKSEMTDAEVYAATVNSVVYINVTGTSTSSNLFGQTRETSSSGSGFVLTKDGYIATNYHVVENANTVKVTMYNGDEYDAAYIGGDEDYDIAVIKVEAEDLSPVTLGNSTDLNVGDHVLAIGNPLGELTFSQTVGSVSCVNRAITVDGTPFNMIQTDTSINPGNSGGPLLNSYGEVVGIVSAKYSTYASESVEGLGFAIPINDVSAMIEDIITNGYVTNKPFLGITPMSMTAQMAAQYRYSVTTGVFVCSTTEGSAADEAGLQMGDVILKVDDTTISTVDDLNAAKKQYSVGDSATLTVYRAGETITVDIVWGATPADETASSSSGSQQQTQDDSQSGSNGYSYSNPYDMFSYFFGNR